MQAKTSLITVLVALALPVAVAPAQQKLPIAVVDLRKVEESMDLTDLKAEQAREEENIQKEVMQLQERGKKLVQDSDTLSAGTMEHLRVVAQIEGIQQEIKWLRTEALTVRKELAAARFFERRQVQITKRIQELAEQKNLLLVLRIRSVSDQMTDERKRFMVLSDRDVLYHHASLDLTDELIKLLKVPEAKTPNDQKQTQAAPAADAKSK